MISVEETDGFDIYYTVCSTSTGTYESDAAFHTVLFIDLGHTNCTGST